MSGFGIGQIISGMDSDTARTVLNQMDDAMIERALEAGMEEEVVPHLIEVRENAVEDYPNPAEVRAHYETMGEDEQAQKFERAAADLMAVAAELRDNPINALSKLKGRLRDPWTTEALLLILDHPDIPDEEVQQRKDYAATWMKYVGVNVIPEVYHREDVRDMVEQMYPDSNAEEILDELDVAERAE